MITTDFTGDALGAFFKLAVVILELAGVLTILAGAALATFLFLKRARLPQARPAR